MKKIAITLAAASATLVLAACGDADDASYDAEAETVEVAAEEALADVAEEPVADETIEAEVEVSGPPAVTQEVAEDAADNAADIAAAVAAAEAGADAVDAATE